MLNNFSNIKVQPVLLANNDISQGWINTCKLLDGVDKVDLPEDYLEFIKQFGEGAIDGHIFIYPIIRLIDETKSWRKNNQTKAEVVFFKKHDRNDCTVIGKTSDDDILFYLNGQYYFSTIQYEEKIYKLGKRIVDILVFFSINRKYGRHDVNSFIPFDSSMR